MRFNKYIWNLYKDSERSRTELNKWTPLDYFPNEKFALNAKESTIDNFKTGQLEKYIFENKVNYYQLRHDYFKNVYDFSKENIQELFLNWIKNGITTHNFVIFPSNKPEYWIHQIKGISSLLYNLYPDYFFPYIFDCEFNKLEKICTEFEIPLPEIPRKKDYLKRALYYLDLCNAFQEFRKMFDLSPAEFCAFLYDFAAKNLLEIDDIEIPTPSKVWFVGGNKDNFKYLDSATEKSIDSWQCNIDTQRGDIIVMYCLSPRSYIHSIWRAQSDGFNDPFFHFYNVAYISQPIILDQNISQRDLSNNLIWSSNPLIKKNLQGINGYPIKYNEYLELLNMLEKKGQNISMLPIIKPTTRLDTDILLDERDVEINLIEPFFKIIGYSPKDWIRQMPVRMGRGERNYPDYCFGANEKRGEESAKMIVESKFEIKTKKQLLETYYQTKSYALRLQSEIFIIASKEGIWIFKQKDGIYNFETNDSFNWIELENPDSIFEIKQSLKTIK